MIDYGLLVATFYLISIITIEIVLFSREKKGFGQQLLATSVLAALFVSYLYFFEAPEWGRNSKPFLLLAHNIITVATPMAIITIFAAVGEKIKRPLSKHIVANLIALSFAFIWPWFALYVSCAIGLDCI